MVSSVRRPSYYRLLFAIAAALALICAVALQAPSPASAADTTTVTVKLIDHNGNSLDPGQAYYHAGGWHSIGDTSGGEISVDLSPGTYSFAMYYNGTRSQQNGVVISGTSDTVTFQTGSVHSDSGTADAYYAAGWRTFTNDMELLPGTYTFGFNDSTGNTQYTLNGGTVNHIH